MGRSTALALLLALSGQASPAQEPSIESGPGLPGSLPGTERWLATFAERSFDLDGLRQAFLERRAPADIEALIAGLAERARADQEPFAQFVERLGGRVIANWWLVNGCALEVPAAAVPELRAHPRVARLQPDRRVASGGAPILTATNGRNHSVDQPQGSGVKGAGVVLAIPDTGFDVAYKGALPANRPNPTFYVNGDRNNLSGGGLYGSRILQAAQMTTMPVDAVDGHGTAVAGVAGGERWSSGPAADPGQAPACSLALYCWAADASGQALLTDMVSTWQRIVTDKAQYRILVANNSFYGSAWPEWIEQQAMDSAALNADIFIAAMAGNTGASTHYSNGATNVLCVGSVQANTRVLSSFSSFGPLEHSAAPHYSWYRNYPDLVANGEDVVMPLADGGDYKGSGTSYATPQVAGAAVLYRSLKASATALETRAAILATLQNVAAANPKYTANGYGMGYLRTDALVKAALGAGSVFNGALSAALPAQKFQLSVSAGTTYAVALSWNRHRLALFDYSDLGLEAKSGTLTLAKADTQVGNTNERLVFRAAASGTVDLHVSAIYLENTPSVPFCVVAVPATPAFSPWAATTFGAGCASPAGVAALAIQGDPVLGMQYTAVLSGVDPRASTGVLILGLSKSLWAGLPLPVDLGPLGAPGCALYTGIQLSAALPGGALPVALPRDQALLGARFFHQALVLYPGANPGNLVTTGGVELLLGGSL